MNSHSIIFVEASPLMLCLLSWRIMPSSQLSQSFKVMYPLLRSSDLKEDICTVQQMATTVDGVKTYVVKPNVVHI